MNLAATAPPWILAILTLLLIAALVEDIARLRISNTTSVSVLVLAIIAIAVDGLSIALWQNALVFALLLVAGTLLFASGKIGGGDVKLFAALGAWVNLEGAFGLLVSVFLAGGVLALGFMIKHQTWGRSRMREGKRSIPYGVAIVAGAVFTFAAQARLL